MLTLIATKMRPPMFTAELIERPRLEDRVAEVQLRRLTIVQAPAGYGKSTLLCRWAQTLRKNGSPVAWITLSASEQDPFVFLSYVVAALESAGVAIDPNIRSIIRRDSFVSADLIAIQLANSLVDAPRPAFLFLDDAHQLASSQALSCLHTLMECTPPSLRVVVATREQLGIPLSRWRATGELAELGTVDLRFVRSEIAQYFSNLGHEPFDEQVLAALEMRTEGWIVGLKLAALALHEQHDIGHWLSGIRGERRQVASFFAEGLWRRQTEEVREFLLHTCVLERLCPSLCDALTGAGNGRNMLDHCERAGLFLSALDDEGVWFRYHPLFAEFLRRWLSDQRPNDPSVLHRRASDWFSEQRLPLEAFNHAVQAQDFMHAANILDRWCEELRRVGELRTLMRIAQQIPARIQALYPRIMLALAWPLVVHWKFAQVKELLVASRARIDELRRSGEATDDELRDLENQALHRETFLALFQDDVVRAEELADRLLVSYTDASEDTKGSIHTTLITARREQYKLHGLDRLDALAREHYARSQRLYVMVAHSAVVGPALFMAGRTQAAIQVLTSGLNEAIRIAPRGASLAAFAALPLGEILYERNALAEAAELVGEHLPMGDEFGFVDQLISGWLTQARLLYLKGDTAGALSALDEAGTVGARFDFERLRLLAGAERIRLLASDGQTDAAVRVAWELSIPTSPSTLAPSSRVSSKDEARALAWTRMALAQHRTNEALPLAQAWRKHMAGANAVRCMIRWDVILTRLYLLEGQSRTAQRILHEAITLAAPGRFVRSFLDEGASIGALLLEQPRVFGRTLSVVESFSAELAAEFENELGQRNAPRSSASDENTTSLYGTLTSQEMQILSYVGARWMNREIGDKLGMTETSVKWYLQQIYDKLGVRKRAHAVDKARKLGLIS